MDKHSQSSDVFSESDIQIEDIDSLLLIFSNTTRTLSESVESEVHKPNFSTQFTSTLEDCVTCITQGFEFLTSLLSDPSLQYEKLLEFIEDAVKLLQALSCYLRNIVQYICMACSSFACLPIATASILYTVFTHCRDSESLYGHNLKSAENQLKNLFRTCHELQVTYLVILDKHYTFDLTNYEEMAILLEALEMNLKIGEIVQTLDVKTMAEQWKGYTMVCEKYSAFLFDKDIFYKSTKILCSMVETNIRNAVELEQEEKMTVRSLKVATFTIKILLKVCNIFKLATQKNYEHILELLTFVYLYNSPYLNLNSNNSPQLPNLMTANVLSPCEVLLKDLLMDENFASALLEIITKIPKDDKVLGYILVILAVIKLIIPKNAPYKVSKVDLIDSVYTFLPYGHIWFNMGLKFKTASNKQHETYGLYEHTLSHVYAVATTLDGDEMLLLEERMFKAVLGLDSYGAMFSINLWNLIARTSPQYVKDQVINLWNVYKLLESHKDIHNRWALSPQRTNFNHILGMLLQITEKCPKSARCKDYLVKLWMSQITANHKHNGIEGVTVVLKQTYETLFTSAHQASKQIKILDILTRLMSTCNINADSSLGEIVVRAWTKACPSDNDHLLQRIHGDMDHGSALYLRYVTSLTALTKCCEVTSFSETEQVKILHVVCCLIQHGNTEMKLALTNLLLDLAFNKIPGPNDHVAECILGLTFRSLYQEKYTLTKEKFYNSLRQHSAGTNVNIVQKIMTNDSKLARIWENIMNIGKSDVEINVKAQLLNTEHLNYVHKCVSTPNETVEVVSSGSDSLKVMDKTNCNNFDFADIDTLFEVDSDDSEPVCKKVRLNSPVVSQVNQLTDIITRIENDTEQLCQIKENVNTEEYKSRLREVCVKLQGISS